MPKVLRASRHHHLQHETQELLGLFFFFLVAVLELLYLVGFVCLRVFTRVYVYVHTYLHTPFKATLTYFNIDIIYFHLIRFRRFLGR